MSHPESPPALCTEAEIRALVEAFYARVRADEVLGPIFDGHVGDWPAHLDQLCDFWSALLLGTKRFGGAPMPKHMALHGLSEALFQRWLGLFQLTTAELSNTALRTEADALAQRIAANLWRHYEQHHGHVGTTATAQPGKQHERA
ncbi:group III truncated hemoglobin [Pseudomonas sp. ABC1]|uniref:group III truncated hemoglobin n=1 Tax=Pseudomonas sp. ABC1 TaxID=2748080 RepID=UPI0015C304A3|nr:group III truncated hemoglobin [Pseudomonas sp. ABC1]QLF93224.1 group III truncated hemoglobin [Pseudomonas sp. ABC1]